MEELERLQNDDDFYEEDEIFDRLEAESRRNSLWKWIVIDILVLAAAIGLLSATYVWKNNAKRVATEYVKVYAKGDWNTVYDYLFLDTEGKPLLSKKMFVTAKATQYDYKMIAHVKVKKVRVLKKQGPHKRIVQVDYVNNDEAFQKKVFLRKIDGTWMVDGNKEYVLPKAYFSVPQGAKVHYDDVLLDPKYIKKTKDGIDHYELQNVFDGYHYVLLEKKGMVKSENIVRFKKKEATFLTMDYSEGTLKKAGNFCLQEISKYYKKNVREPKVFVSMRLKNNNISVKNSEDAPGMLEVVVESSYEYRFKPTRNNWFPRVRRGKCINRCLCTFENGTFRLQDMTIDDSML